MQPISPIRTKNVPTPSKASTGPSVTQFEPTDASQLTNQYLPVLVGKIGKPSYFIIDTVRARPGLLIGDKLVARPEKGFYLSVDGLSLTGRLDKAALRELKVNLEKRQAANPQAEIWTSRFFTYFKVDLDRFLKA
jgi:hypothetical protein